MRQTKSEKLTITGMLLAVGIVLPFATSHGLGFPGTVLLPMHIPVLLCGLLCGPLYGALCGALLPALNCLLTGMPTPFPMLPIMLCELTVYGAVSGALYNHTRLKNWRFGCYPALIVAMLCGRVAYGGMFWLLFALNGSLKALTVWGALVTGLPGIVVQLLLIPAVVLAVERVFRGRRRSAVDSAMHLIAEGTATCVVLQHNTVVKTASGRGIAPIIALYESGELRDAYVVDKIIGKAAAMVLTLGGVHGCYGQTVSRAAVDYLTAHHIPVRYDTCVEHIINRTGDGVCPMEQTVQDIDDPAEGLAALKETLARLRANQSDT